MSEDALVARLKGSVGTSAELKLSLINLRSNLPDHPIFVFEGEDDRAVYYSWTRFVDASIRYEPFTCKGKSALLRLKGSVDRDVNGLSRNTFFFIDSDFDGSRGMALDSSIYMTDGYSIENHLVNGDVVDETLKVELNCHGSPNIRAALGEIFANVYAEFLRVTRDVNLYIFAVRKLGLDTESPLPASLGRAVVISMHSVTRDASVTAESVVRPVRPVEPEEAGELESEFGRLNPQLHYRGKFALSFMLRWLDAVAVERRSPQSEIFRGMDMESRTRVDRLNVSSLSVRSQPPESFSRFIRDCVSVRL